MCLNLHDELVGYRGEQVEVQRQALSLAGVELDQLLIRK